MNNELNLPNNAYPLDVFVALSELQDDVVKAQAAAAAKETELAELREQTAELFAERLRAEGADDEAVAAAKAMWAENPSLAAQAALGVDIAEAANPYGCNQYGEGWKQPHNGKQSKKGSAVKKDDDKKDASPAKKAEEDAQKKADELYKLMDEVKKYRNFANKRIIDSSIDEWTKALSKGKTALQQAETAEEKEEAMKQHLRTIKYGKMLFEDYIKEYSSH